MSGRVAPLYLRDPSTLSRRERIDQYIVQAARYRQMAEREDRLVVRKGLLDLAGQCDSIAQALELAG